MLVRDAEVKPTPKLHITVSNSTIKKIFLEIGKGLKKLMIQKKGKKRRKRSQDMRRHQPEVQQPSIMRKIAQ